MKIFIIVCWLYFGGKPFVSKIDDFWKLTKKGDWSPPSHSILSDAYEGFLGNGEPRLQGGKIHGLISFPPSRISALEGLIPTKS